MKKRRVRYREYAMMPKYVEGRARYYTSLEEAKEAASKATSYSHQSHIVVEILGTWWEDLEYYTPDGGK